ncbi:AAA family ATPase [Kribbella sp.]|uniref:AAA family ATPase n=1 Tax=Kribbella sp. TaxID=1871183 RepID=UPI002D35AD58|nr:AAA family ATPase [Kribbella sp.]HZX08213.1 AAA family ATPase [Kribbella sp.]
MTSNATVKVRVVAPVPTFRGIAADLFTTAAGCCLGARTFVYGRNGTGKTTFAELLRQGARGDVAVTAEYFENNGWHKGALSAALGSRIHIFNRFYIEEHLKFFLDGSGPSAGILKLGAVNVSAETSGRELEQETIRHEARVEAVIAAGKESAARVDKLKADAKRRVLDVLGPVLPLKYTKQIFTVAKAHKALIEEAAAVLTEEEVDAAVDFLSAEEFQPLAVPQDPTGAGLTLVAQVAELAGRELTSQISEALEADRMLADWVRAGLALHPAGGERCKFCMDGVLSAETREIYAAHFDQSLRELQADLERTAEDLVRLNQAMVVWHESLPSPNDLLPGHRSGYEGALDALKVLLDEWKAYLEALAGLVGERLNDPYRPLLQPLPTAPSSMDLSKLAGFVDGHNTDVGRQAGLREQAEAGLVAHLIEPFRVEYAAARHRVPAADRARERLESRIKRLAVETEKLRSQQHDVGQMAELINSDLADTFGHVHISLRVTEDGTSYEVLRSNGPALHLSEGERHALALLYFLRSLEAEGVSPQNGLVVIDDPVTGLDKDALFAAYALVDERTKKFGQIVVLTHDHELFRLFLMRYKKVLASSRGAIGRRDRDEIRFPRVQFLEMRACDGASGERRVNLLAMPNNLLNQPTEYHYIFYRIAEAAAERNTSDLILLGNAARRLLEGFVAFKSPTGGDFQGKIESAANQAKVPEEFTQRVVRFAHGSSHREEPNPSVSFTANIPDELAQVLRFIWSCDENHFNGMCRAVDVNLGGLVGTWKRQRYDESPAARPVEAVRPSSADSAPSNFGGGEADGGDSGKELLF